MDGKQLLLAALVGLLVLALWFFSVAAGNDRGGEADPDQAGGLELLEDLIAAVPGVGRSLRADDIDADCFADGRFTVRELAGCSFEVADGIDRGALRIESGSCSVSIRDQDDTPNQRIKPTQAREGVIRLALDGTGATVTVSPGPCVLELA